MLLPEKGGGGVSILVKVYRTVAMHKGLEPRCVSSFGDMPCVLGKPMSRRVDTSWAKIREAVQLAGCCEAFVHCAEIIVEYTALRRLRVTPTLLCIVFTSAHFICIGLLLGILTFRVPGLRTHSHVSSDLEAIERFDSRRILSI